MAKAAAKRGKNKDNARRSKKKIEHPHTRRRSSTSTTRTSTCCAGSCPTGPRSAPAGSPATTPSSSGDRPGDQERPRDGAAALHQPGHDQQRGGRDRGDRGDRAGRRADGPPPRPTLRRRRPATSRPRARRRLSRHRVRRHRPVRAHRGGGRVLMQLILRSDVDGVGKKGDIVEVADGFARNYLAAHGASPSRPARRRRGRRPRPCAAPATSRTPPTGAPPRRSPSGWSPATITSRLTVGPEGELFGSVASGRDRRGRG